MTNNNFATGYHITSYPNYLKILSDERFNNKGFNIKVFEDNTKKTNMPNDLGDGTYFFLESGYVVPPKQICIYYFHGVKKHSYGIKYGIIKSDIDLDEDKFFIYDLNDKKARIEFDKLKEKYKDLFTTILNDRIISSNALNRAQKNDLIDGIAFEFLCYVFQKNGDIIDAIMMDTLIEFAPFYSRVQNCTEICIRNHDMITSFMKG